MALYQVSVLKQQLKLIVKQFAEAVTSSAVEKSQPVEVPTLTKSMQQLTKWCMGCMG
ncbi:hypothetical protein ITJ86_04360 [Winogradskyella sp. F6397]|uniref:Uncharacterized protein n=1 Tax=Winogradskyella marina TaxID=2785530 RepID=A0ABS0EHZ5_9FLAO|nr:hypothetical protein [Winogradskyella marina]MBF8149115.1 hypothetical protein [Winogradskyella marina]